MKIKYEVSLYLFIISFVQEQGLDRFLLFLEEKAVDMSYSVRQSCPI